jgi:hypothetical protein
MGHHHPEFERTVRSGLPYWLHLPTGRLLPVVSGGATDDGDSGREGEGEGENGDGSGDSGGTQDRTLTQAEVDRIIAREKAAARRAAERDVQAYLEAEKAKADEAALSEAERAKAEAARERAEADRLKAEAAAERLTAKLERRLLAAGVPDAALTRVVRMVDLPADADDDTIAAEIDALKADAPALFTPPDGDSNGRQPKPPGTTAARGPAGGQGTTTAIERGRERWAAKHPPKTQAS